MAAADTALLDAYIRSAASDWPAVQRAWAPATDLTGPEWAAKHRVLTRADSSEPGPWNNLRAPYLVGIMAACTDRAVREAVIIKPSQAGGSEAVRNAAACWIDQDPGDILLVLPDRETAKRILVKRWHPLLKSTPRLRRYITGRPRDFQGHHITLKHMWMRVAWSGSASLLASDPFRRVILDETDKYAAWTGEEGDPITLARVRTKTFRGREMIILLTTPTVKTGYGWTAYENTAAKLHYQVPCPHCGRYQVLSWGNVQFPKGRELGTASREETADRILRDDLAWYRCPHCEGSITEIHKPQMLAAGVWASPLYEGDDGRVITPELIQSLVPRLAARSGRDTVDWRGNILWTDDIADATSIGFQFSGLYSPWETFSSIASSYLKAIGDTAKMMGWVNNCKGEPFEQEATAVRAGEFQRHIDEGHPTGVVPAWASCLLAVADSQLDGYVWGVRAFGPGERSRLIANGVARDDDELWNATMASRWPSEDANLEPLQCYRLGIDAGGGAPEGDDANITHRVYRFALANDPWVIPIHGHGGLRPAAVPHQLRSIKYQPPGSAESLRVVYLRVDTGTYKDVLARRIKGKPNDDGSPPDDLWEIHAGVDQDYCLQMAAEHKVLDRRSGTLVWRKQSVGAAEHMWDVEVYLTALATYLQVGVLPTFDEQRKLAAASRAYQPAPDGDTSSSGWKIGR